MCNTDKIPMDGFQVSASRLVCLETNGLYNTTELAAFSRDLHALAERQLGVDLGPRKSHEVYFVYHTDQLHQLSFISVRTMLLYTMVHSLLYRNYSDTAPGVVALYPLPDDIVLQASEMVLNAPMLRDMCKPTVPLRKQNKSVIIVCSETSEYKVRGPSMLPLALFNIVLTRKVNSSGKKYLGRATPNGAGEFKSTNAQLGTVNRPRLCIYPGLILLLILVLLSVFSRIWFSSRNITLELWQNKSNSPDISDTSNPIFPYGPAPETSYATSVAF